MDKCIIINWFEHEWKRYWSNTGWTTRRSAAKEMSKNQASDTIQQMLSDVIPGVDPFYEEVGYAR